MKSLEKVYNKLKKKLVDDKTSPVFILFYIMRIMPVDIFIADKLMAKEK